MLCRTFLCLFAAGSVRAAVRLWRLEHAVFELHEAGKSYKEEISVFIEKDARADARLRPAGAVCAGKGRGRAPDGYRVEPDCVTLPCGPKWGRWEQGRRTYLQRRLLPMVNPTGKQRKAEGFGLFSS